MIDMPGFIFKSKNFEKFDKFLRKMKKEAREIAEHECTTAVVYIATTMHDVDVVSEVPVKNNYLDATIHNLVEELHHSSMNDSGSHPLDFGFSIYYKLVDDGFLCAITAQNNPLMLNYIATISHPSIKIEWVTYSEHMLANPGVDEETKKAIKANKIIWENSLEGFEIPEVFHACSILAPFKLYLKDRNYMEKIIPSAEERIKILARDLDIQEYVNSNNITEQALVYEYHNSDTHKENAAKLVEKFAPMINNCKLDIGVLTVE